ncbi:MAG TPA: hypothetical protein EYP88_05060 [Anaerolineales bacterium]|nr:hypothetical protein [Anaerolineales bacterium]
MKKVKISANPNHPDPKKRFTHEITIVLGDEIKEKYEVVAKDFPADLPEFWIDPNDDKEKKIAWIANFGLRTPGGRFADTLPKGYRYQIEIPHLPGKTVYFDGSRVRELPGKVDGNKFIAELDLGDPPIGKTTG